jgi:hypothetical protein
LVPDRRANEFEDPSIRAFNRQHTPWQSRRTG